MFLRTEMEETKVPDDSVKCQICGELPEYFHADRTKGESLPAAAYKLVTIADDLEKCSLCGTYFQRRYVYEYLVYGSEEDDYLERISREQAIELLLNARKLNDNVFSELKQLGITDAYARMMSRLKQTLDSQKEEQNDRHYALLTLFDYYTDTNSSQIDELFEHPDQWVRWSTLYFLINRGAKDLPRILKRLSDPEGKVRNYAVAALQCRAERNVDISGVLPELINLLAGDPEVDVRRQAAYTIAAAANQGTDITTAVAALTTALSNKSLTLSAATALRNAAVKGTDIAQAWSPLRQCCEGENIYKPLRDAALEALGYYEAMCDKRTKKNREWKWEQDYPNSSVFIIDGTKLHWSSDYDDCGRMLRDAQVQTAEEYLKKGPPDCYRTGVPIAIYKEVAAYLGNPNPDWLEKMDPSK